MSAHNTPTKLFAAVLSLILPVALWGRGAPRAEAQAERRDEVEPNVVLIEVVELLELFAVVGLVFPTQSAQLNVTLVESDGGPRPQPTPPEEDEMVPVELLIYDARGRVLARTGERLAVNQTTSLHLNGERIGAADGRVLIRAEVRAGRLRPRQRILSSLEVMDDATRQTTLLMNGRQVRLKTER